MDATRLTTSWWSSSSSGLCWRCRLWPHRRAKSTQDRQAANRASCTRKAATTAAVSTLGVAHTIRESAFEAAGKRTVDLLKLKGTLIETRSSERSLSFFCCCCAVLQWRPRQPRTRVRALVLGGRKRAPPGLVHGFSIAFPVLVTSTQSSITEGAVL